MWRGLWSWWARRDDGTASMETLLCLPFMLVLLVAVVDLGFANVVRIKAQGAVRFAATSHLRAPVGSDRSRFAAEQLERFYGGLELGTPLLVRGPDSPVLGKRRLTRITAPVDPPFGTFLTAGEIEASFLVMDHKVWTYNKVPLAVGPLLRKARNPRLDDYVGSELGAVIRALVSVVQVFARWLGMEP